MSGFAKLIDTERGQVLAKLDSNDEGYEVRIFFNPKGLGVCSIAFNFEEDKAEDAEKLFENMTDEKIKLIAFETLNKIEGE